MKTLLLILSFFLVTLCYAQEYIPRSLTANQDLQVFSYDGKTHRSVTYYRALAQVVQVELGMDTTMVASIRVVFMPDSIMQMMVHRSPALFKEPGALYGYYVQPILILMEGDDESDNIFMHEYMHHLHYIGRIFMNVPDEEKVHQLVHMNDGLLLGSKSYIQFLESGVK